MNENSPESHLVKANKTTLPKGWVSVSLDDICANGKNSIKRGPFGSTIKKEYFVKSGYKVYEQKNVIYNNFELGSYYIDGRKFNELHEFELRGGDIIISCSGTIGKVALAPDNIKRGVINQALLKITLDRRLIIPRFFVYLFSSEIVQETIPTRGTAMKNISSVKALKASILPLPPLSEQQRIIAKLEQLFTKLDAAVDALKKTKIHLKNYRQSILKHAFEGKLTEKWRSVHIGAEPAQMLVEDLAKERRMKWEKNQLARAETFKRTLSPTWKAEYHEPEPPKVNRLLRLPDNWVWATAEQLTSSITDGEHVTPKRSNNGVLLLSARNVLDGRLSLDKVDFVPEDIYDLITRRMVIEPGDVLLSCSGSVGRSCVVPEKLRLTLVRSVALLKPLSKMGKIISYALRSPLLQLQISEKKTQTAQSNLFQGKIKKLIFPLPPKLEQEKIMQEIDLRFSVIDKTAQVVDQILNASLKLRESFLRTAFQGNLVIQDPDQEPASILLKRIMENKEKHEIVKKKVFKQVKNKTHSHQGRLV